MGIAQSPAREARKAAAAPMTPKRLQAFSTPITRVTGESHGPDPGVVIPWWGNYQDLPDVVLLKVGTNDVDQKRTPEAPRDNIKAIIEALYSLAKQSNRSVRIFNKHLAYAMVPAGINALQARREKSTRRCLYESL